MDIPLQVKHKAMRVNVNKVEGKIHSSLPVLLDSNPRPS